MCNLFNFNQRAGLQSRLYHKNSTTFHHTEEIPSRTMDNRGGEEVGVAAAGVVTFGTGYTFFGEYKQN
jgi:hypothetical protein